MENRGLTTSVIVLSNQIDPIANLPSSLGQYAHTFLSTVLWYCMKVINWEKDKTLPQELCSQRAQTM